MSKDAAQPYLPLAAGSLEQQLAWSRASANIGQLQLPEA